MTRHTTKAGRRHKQADQDIVDKWGKSAKELEADMTALGARMAEDEGEEGEPSDKPEAEGGEEPRLKGVDVSTETLISFGSEIKTLPNGHFGGYLVRFSTQDDPDLTGDYFTKNTDFGIEPGAGAKTPVYFNHRYPIRGRDGAEIVIKKKIGDAVLDIDDTGVLIDAILYNRDEYEKAINLAGNKKWLGWSSGTASHLVDRELTGKSWEIKKWDLGLDASVTPTPAEPRNNTIPLKTFFAGQTAGQPGADAPPATAPSETTKTTPQGEPSNEDTIMPETIEQLTAMIADTAKAVGELTTTVKGMAAQKPTLPDSEGVDPTKASRSESGEVKEKGGPFKSLGEQLMAIKAYATPNAEGREAAYNKLKAVKATGASEGSGPDGGFRIQSEFTNEVLDRVYNTGQVLSLVRKRAIGPGANGLTINTINETSRADGSRFGGVQAFWLNEGGTKTASRPTYRRFSLNLEKLIGLYYATDELLQDDVALEGEVSDMFAQEINFKAEDAIFNGTGNGMPIGIIPNSATISVAKESGQAAATVVYQNLIKMWARMWAPSRSTATWFINQDLEPQLDQLYLAAGTAGLEPRFITYGPDGVMRIKNRPVVPVEYAQTVGTVGDITLADMQGYRWIDKGGVQSASSIHVAFVTDESAFRWVYRCNGAPFWASVLTPKNGTNTLGQFVTLATRA